MTYLEAFSRPTPVPLLPLLHNFSFILHPSAGREVAPASPYQFDIIEPEILGRIYERFLGSKIWLTEGHRAKVEEKPEVRHAGGVYYTPQWVVDYIVEHTVGEKIKGKTPAEIETLKILDPACGSGSFLLGAFDRLIRYHEEWYAEHKKDKAHARDWYQTAEGDVRLTVEKKGRILKNNLFGVDIDREATEVAIMSLYLKLLDKGFDKGQMMLYMRGLVLPDLTANIKCGNSLIGQDFYQGRQLDMFSDEDRKRINAFDWDREFPAIMKGGGFDVVIGNPPYVRQETLSEFKDYFSKQYEAYHGVADLYAYFIERGLDLLRANGRFSIIVSSSFLRATYGESLRRQIKKHAGVLRIVDFGGLAVFENAKDTYVCIPLFVKTEQPQSVEVSRIPSLQIQDLKSFVEANHYFIPHVRLEPDAWSLKSDDEAHVFEKITKAGIPLCDFAKDKICYGIKTGLNEAFIIDSKTRTDLIRKDANSAELIHPMLGGEDIRRYVFHEADQWLIFTRRGVRIKDYPAIMEHLSKWKEDLTPKRDKNAKRGRKPGRYEWYEIQDDVAYWEVFDQAKIIYPDIAKGPRFCLDREGHYLSNTAYCIGVNDPYLLGLLNSKLFWFAISNISIPFGVRAGQYRYRLIYQYMEKVPVRIIDFTNNDDKVRHGQIVDLVGTMLTLHKKISAAKLEEQKNLFQRQIDATDRQIDKLVYELYGLNDEEIYIVEGKSHE
jgi:hypothetical protein